MLKTMRDTLVTTLLFSGHLVFVTYAMTHEILFPLGTLAHAMLLHLVHLAGFSADLDYLVLFTHLLAGVVGLVLQAFQVAAS